MYRSALFTLSILFFMMGFITCLNDILVPFLKEIFKLSYGEAALVQLSFFGAYGLTSIPISRVIEKTGYQIGMISGLCITSFGCLLFYPAVSFHKFPLFLMALFVLASGIVFLQVAANSFVSILGPKESASSRLAMVQAFNSFGTFIAPFFGSIFILSKLKSDSGIDGIKAPYIGIAVALILLMLFLSQLKFPQISQDTQERKKTKDLLKESHLIWGIIGIFAYVGAEVAIGSFLVNYVMEFLQMPKTEAANYVAIYWGGAMAGRFLGIFTLKEFNPARVLNIHALLAISLILISINSHGMMAIYSIVLVGFCNSIMFPTIFTLSLNGLNSSAHKASGLLATSILGGAIIPFIVGQMADHVGLRMAFTVPVFCYIFIAYFGNKMAKSL
ncbi:MAG: sugar MFS transporter [Bacteriovoracaceae bacterium]